MVDLTCLAEGQVFPADFNKTGINLNELIVGSTGSGKSVSINESRLLHTINSSLVIPIAKKSLKEKYTNLFKERGYNVIDLDFAHPENCKIGYDPLDSIHSERDIIQTAKTLIGLEKSSSRDGTVDPYWNDSATSVLAAEIAYVKLISEDNRCKATFADVAKLHRELEVNTSGSTLKTSLDPAIEKLNYKHPHNQSYELWKTVKGLSSRTASCIFSIVNNALDKILSKEIIEITGKDKKISFKKLGQEKTALFITTSPMNTTLKSFINLMYSDMFKELFEEAENKENGALDIPVHIICDDFACTSKITDFENYISIFRAAKISVTILLQSESQLSSMYGKDAATTIINNCDTYVYMGGMDVETCRNIGLRMNKPINRVMSLPLEKVIVFRRGLPVITGKRYQTYEDPLYKLLIDSNKAKDR